MIGRIITLVVLVSNLLLASARAESLADLLMPGQSLENGSLVYTNFSATLSPLASPDGGLGNGNPDWWRGNPVWTQDPYHYDVVPSLHDIDVSATSGGLLTRGIQLSGYNYIGPLLTDVSLTMQYEVHGETVGATVSPPTGLFSSANQLLRRPQILDRPMWLPIGSFQGSRVLQVYESPAREFCPRDEVTGRLRHHPVDSKRVVPVGPPHDR